MHLRFSSLILAVVVSNTVAVCQTGAADHVLAPGDPPLTQSILDRRLAVWETFLDIHLTPEERQRITKAIISNWPTNRNTLELTFRRVLWRISEIIRTTRTASFSCTRMKPLIPTTRT